MTIENPYAAPEADVVRVETGGEYEYTRKSRVLTKLLLVLLGVGAFVHALLMIRGVWVIKLYGGVVTPEEIELARLTRVGLSFVGTISFWTTVVVWGMWTYRANVNSRGFGAHLEHSPRMAVFSYLVPVLSWFRPYQAMKEILQASVNPKLYSTVTCSRILPLWWSLWMGAFVLRLVTGVKFGSWVALEEYLSMLKWGVFEQGWRVALCLVALQLIRRIASNQERLVSTGERAPTGVEFG